MNERKNKNSRKDSKPKECIICLSNLPQDFSKSSDSNLNYSKCEHEICSTCLSKYLEHQITENKLPIKCPKENCKESVKPAFIMKLFKKEEKLLNKFLNFSLVNNKEISWCPSPKCDYGFICKDDDLKFDCPKCLKTYCLKCQCEFHNGIICKDYKRKKAKEKDEDEENFLNHARNFKLKQCPECKKWIEKKEGCNHITCKCKYEFCYICGEKYSTNHGECQYKFIDNKESEVKTLKQKDEKIIKNDIQSKISADTFSSIRQKTTIFNDRDIPLNFNNDFNSFNHYSDLLNTVSVNSGDYPNDNDSKRDREQEQANHKLFTELKNSKLDEKPLQIFLDASLIKNNERKNSLTNSFGGRLKKDGTLDMRYSENKYAKQNDSMSTYSTCKYFFFKLNFNFLILI